MHAASYCGVNLLGRVTTVVAPVLLAMPMASGRQPAGALVVPKAGVIEVTGYEVVAEAGSRGSITVIVNGQSAKVLRAALETSPPWTPPRQVCLESLNPFLISVLPRRGARSTIVARAVDTCDGQYVMVTVGKLTTDVKDDCVLQSAVVAALPRGQANATRMDIAGACTKSAGS